MLIMGGAFYYQSSLEKASAIDEVTLCPKAGPVAMDSILIDLTDNLAPVHVAKLEQILDQKIKAAPAGTLFTVGVVTDDRSELGAQFSLCKPKSGADVSAMNQNVRLVEERYEHKFLQPMKGILEGLLEPHEAKESPIMEAIQLLVSETPGFEAFNGPKELLVVSDLLQHSEAMSFYRGESWETFSSSRAFSRLSKSLDGADVTFLAIPRPESWKGDFDQVGFFWQRYVDIQGANRPELRTLGDL